MNSSLEVLITSLHERTGERLSRGQLLYELALLFLWKVKLQSNNDFTNKNLADVYGQLDDELFARSQLPQVLSLLDSEEFLKELNTYNKLSIYEIANSIYKDYSISEGAKYGFFDLPEELLKLMHKLSMSEGRDVYIPYSNSFQLAIKASSSSSVLFGIENELPIFQVFARLVGFKVKNVSPGGLWVEDISLKEDEILDTVEFDNILSVFPFELRARKSFESLGYLVGVRCTKRAVLLVSEGVLFRGADELELRKQLVEDGQVEAVIHLPTPSIKNTSISLSLLVIDKTRDPDSPIVFYDADNDQLCRSGGRGQPQLLFGWDIIADEIINKKDSSFSTFVNKEEIRNNKYDLSVRKYVLGDASARIRMLENTKSLSDIAELIRGQLLKEEKQPTGDFFYEVGVKDIGENGILNKPKKKLQLTEKMKDRAIFQKLHPGDILLVSKGSVGKVAYVGEDCGDNWVASQSFQIVRLKQSKSIDKPEYLFSYLASSLVQKYWSEQVTGTAIPVLKTTDIKELPIPILPIGKQEEIVETHKKILDAYQEIENIHERIDVLRDSNWSLS